MYIPHTHPVVYHAVPPSSVAGSNSILSTTGPNVGAITAAVMAPRIVGKALPEMKFADEATV